MIHLINHTSAEQYWFSGNSMAQIDAAVQRPLAATGAFLTEANQLLFEGTYRPTPASNSHHFSVRFFPPFTKVVAVEVSTPHLGEILGHMYALGSGYQLLATSATGNVVSAGIELNGDHDLQVTGVITLGGSSFGFSATRSPSADRTSGANVVGILGNRGA